MYYKVNSIQKIYHLQVLIILFAMTLFFTGCISNLTGYYKTLRTKIETGDYEEASEFINKSKRKYGSKNILMYYLDLGIVAHFAGSYDTSLKIFERAKRKFEEYYQKSISANAASMFFNDTIIPYYGQDFERVHISIFEALDYVLMGHNEEAVVEARQINTLFKALEIEGNYKNFYKDDGFIRYFMGLIYENAGYINDAHISYYKALKAYKNGIADVIVPKELIDDAYTSALILGMENRAKKIKASYPSASKRLIPKDYGECIVVNYNGFIPEKIDNILEFALGDIWIYVDSVEVSDKEEQEFNQAKSIGLSVFAKDYVKVSFVKYKDFKNNIVSFKINNPVTKGIVVQNLGKIAKKCLDNDIKKIYAKTLARAAVKYVIGKSVSKEIEKRNGSTWGRISQISFNMYSSLSEKADKRAWNTLPDKILMARFYLPKGYNTLTVDFLGLHGEILQSCNLEIDILEGKKNFITIRSSKVDMLE